MKLAMLKIGGVVLQWLSSMPEPNASSISIMDTPSLMLVQ